MTDPFDVIAGTRFGYGAGPGAFHGGADAVLAMLSGPDRAGALWRRPEGAASDAHEGIDALRDIARIARREGDTKALTAQRNEIAAVFRAGMDEHARLSLARILDGPEPFRERLVWFWADHFAISARTNVERALAPDYVESAIRPHVAGRFADILRAATLHPMMLTYLDQESSFGPGSERAARRPGRGLNENHARELLELHTLGVAGGYGQGDVRELAELMTGLTTDSAKRPLFDDWRAEPGPETVLGRTYGGDPATPAHVEEALEALALHPDTARHVAGKLAAHFVADAPPAALVAALEAAYLEGSGALMPLYEVLLTHPDALAAPPTKIRRPFEWMGTAMRALGLTGADVMGLEPRAARRSIHRPLADMGQPHLRPPGPDGWPEEAGRWSEPQSLAARITWAMQAPQRLLPELPDPRSMLEAALPWGAPDELAFAARAAESRRDGVGLILVSPALLRR